METAQINSALVGGLVTLIFAVITYFVKDSFDNKKKAIEKASKDIDKNKEHYTDLERSLLTEISKISEKIESLKFDYVTKIHDFDKEFNSKMASILTTLTALSSSSMQYQKDLAKMEGKLEEVIKVAEEFRGESKVNSMKFDRIFSYIDSKPDSYKNLSREIKL